MNSLMYEYLYISTGENCFIHFIRNETDQIERYNKHIPKKKKKKKNVDMYPLQSDFIPGL